MEAVAYAIAPDTVDMDISFDHGSVQVVIRDGQIWNIQVFCNGSMQIILSDTAVSLRAELQFNDSAVEASVPDVVMETLEK